MHEVVALGLHAPPYAHAHDVVAGGQVGPVAIVGVEEALLGVPPRPPAARVDLGLAQQVLVRGGVGPQHEHAAVQVFAAVLWIDGCHRVRDGAEWRAAALVEDLVHVAQREAVVVEVRDLPRACGPIGMRPHRHAALYANAHPHAHARAHARARTY